MPPKKKGKRKGKPKTKAQRAAAAEERRKAEELERVRLLEEEKLRVERERLEAALKAIREIEERAWREEQLAASCLCFQQLDDKMYEKELATRANEEWMQYLTCDGLPDPANLSEVNTFLYLWRLDEDTEKIDVAIRVTHEVISILSVLEELIDNPLDVSEKHVEDWKTIRNDLRKEQEIHLDRATYWLLRRMEEQLDVIDLTEVRYFRECPDFRLCMWTLLPLPENAIPAGTEIKIEKKCMIQELGIDLRLPFSLGTTHLVIRALWLQYDHYSDLCPTWEVPPTSEEPLKDMHTVMAQEDAEKCEILESLLAAEAAALEEDRLLRLKLIQERMEEEKLDAEKKKKKKNKGKKQSKKDKNKLPPPPIEDLIPKRPPMRTPAEVFEEREDQYEAEMQEELVLHLEEEQLNLRKYAIIGGIVNIELLEQPPQPRELNDGVIVTVLPVPKDLKRVIFNEPYLPPARPEKGKEYRQPEEIEAELKKQEEDMDAMALARIAQAVDEEMEKQEEMWEAVVAEWEQQMVDERMKQAFIEISLPTNVLWFDPPIIAGWDADKGYWSTKNYYDVKFDEEKQVLSFRTGLFGPMCLAVYRYSNLPFQTWELRPDVKTNGVILSITGVVLVLEFTIKEDQVCLSLIKNAGNKSLHAILDKYFKLHELIRVMQRGGVDIFPLQDAFCYVEGGAPKHRVAERHLYRCMGLFSTAYNFSWSRWNLQAGRRNMVLQMREYNADKHKMSSFSILHITPLRACIVDCTEVSQEFVQDGIEGMKFYADLYQLVEDYGSSTAKKKIKDISFAQAECVFKLLYKTKLLSFA